MLLQAPPLRLTEPVRDLAASYAAALREGLHENPPSPDDLARLESDFDQWLADEFDLSRRIIRDDGSEVERVPYSEFWLARGAYFIGRVTVRHRLNEHLEKFGGHIGYAIRPAERKKGYGKMLLQQILPVAKALGLSRALLTVNDHNEGSIKIIEAAGGVLQDTVPRPDKPGLMHRRYWIDL